MMALVPGDFFDDIYGIRSREYQKKKNNNKVVLSLIMTARIELFTPDSRVYTNLLS